MSLNNIGSFHFTEMKAPCLHGPTDLSSVHSPWPLWPPLPFPTCSLCCGHTGLLATLQPAAMLPPQGLCWVGYQPAPLPHPTLTPSLGLHSRLPSTLFKEVAIPPTASPPHSRSLTFSLTWNITEYTTEFACLPPNFYCSFSTGT